VWPREGGREGGRVGDAGCGSILLVAAGVTFIYLLFRGLLWEYRFVDGVIWNGTKRKKKEERGLALGYQKWGIFFYSAGALVALYFFLFHSMNWAVKLEFREFVSFFQLFPHI